MFEFSIPFCTLWTCGKGTATLGASSDSCSVCSLLGWIHLMVSVVSFLFFTDMLIYWIHRGLHHRLVYKVESHSEGRRGGDVPHFSIIPLYSGF
jgi:sterol desaturase/sphingolipid hydroxylase (fatty acid hydroxylase superfamily)